MERERSPCQMLMTRSVQCEWKEDWVGAWGRRAAWTALSRDEFSETQVEEKKKKRQKKKISYTHWKNTGKLFVPRPVLHRTKIVSWRVSGCQNGDRNPWAVLCKAGRIAPAQEWLWCIARDYIGISHLLYKDLGRAKQWVWSWIFILCSHRFICYPGSLVLPYGDPLLPAISKAQWNASYRISIKWKWYRDLVLHSVREFKVSKTCSSFSGHPEFFIDHNELISGQLKKIPQYIKPSSAVQRWMISYQQLQGNVLFT